MYGFSKYDAQDRYDSYNTVQVKLKLNMKTDADILAWVRQHKYGRDTSVQGAIRVLIREDIARGRPMGHKVNPPAFYIRWLSAALTGIP